MRVLLSLLAAITASVPMLLASDVYDVQTANDNSPGTTRNELTHGTEQWHDLATVNGVLDQDWFRVRQQPYSSYEVVVDSASGDLANMRFSRIAADGVTVLQNSVAAGLGFDRSLRFANTTATAVDGEFIAVRSGTCLVPCGSDDVYRIRMRETTAAIPRFNNSGTSTTVLLLQNPSAAAVNGTVYFWSASGVLMASTPLALGPRALLSLTTSVLVPAQSGSITVVHDGRYGELAGKAVGLESATGFSYDTPLVHKAH